MKKEWSKPKLIVLFRGRPEEAVLAACKDGAGNAAGAVETQCNTDTCADCVTIAGS